MRFEFIAKHRGIWPVSWICEALGVSRSGFHAWLVRAPSARARSDDEFGARVRASFISSYRTYGARRVWHDLLAEGLSCGLHRIDRLMRVQGLRARPRRRGLPKDDGLRSVIADNILDRQFTAEAPNQRWIADFTYIWTAEGWLYVAVVIDLFSRRAGSRCPAEQGTASIACSSGKTYILPFMVTFGVPNFCHLLISISEPGRERSAGTTCRVPRFYFAAMSVGRVLGNLSA